MGLKIIRLTVMLILVSIVPIGCGDREIKYNYGQYIGTGEGHEGVIKVEVTTTDYEIKSIKILEEYEMPEISRHVYDDLIKKIIDKNDANVDIIAGATYTSSGLIEATKEALRKAGRDD